MRKTKEETIKQLVSLSKADGVCNNIDSLDCAWCVIKEDCDFSRAHSKMDWTKHKKERCDDKLAQYTQEEIFEAML